jgi:hypothetical protein
MLYRTRVRISTGLVEAVAIAFHWYGQVISGVRQWCCLAHALFRHWGLFLQQQMKTRYVLVSG